MHNNYKADEQIIINIIYRHIKPTKPQKQIKLSVSLNLKHPTSSLRITQTPQTQTSIVYKFTCPYLNFPNN